VHTRRTGCWTKGNDTAACGKSETEEQSRLSEVGHQSVIGGGRKTKLESRARWTHFGAVNGRGTYRGSGPSGLPGESPVVLMGPLFAFRTRVAAFGCSGELKAQTVARRVCLRTGRAGSFGLAVYVLRSSNSAVEK
jgi:hypothetical protein